MQTETMQPDDIIDALGQTIGKSKAEKLVSEAMDDLGIDETDFDESAAAEILETIPEMEDDSLVSVAASTTKTQLLR